ncbi:Multicopy suppressor of chk1 protein 1 [Fusarium oxysporum f. sp. albedinis]|nr:Multicopy suppressor of chk1 protein 1 [Fusarium oxysporum f. sp. albedinis]
MLQSRNPIFRASLRPDQPKAHRRDLGLLVPGKDPQRWDATADIPMCQGLSYGCLPECTDLWSYRAEVAGYASRQRENHKALVLN